MLGTSVFFLGPSSIDHLLGPSGCHEFNEFPLLKVNLAVVEWHITTCSILGCFEGGKLFQDAVYLAAHNVEVSSKTLAFLLCVQYRYWFTIGKVAGELPSPCSICILTFYAGSRNAEEITLGLAQS